MSDNPEPLSLTEAAKTGDRRKALEALRDRLAVEVERVAHEGFCLECKRGSSSIAPLAKQLADVVSALDALPTGKEVSVVDEIAKRRTDRRAKPAV